MKIELKNIHYSAALSEETNAFTANLYINGNHVGIAKNDGHGGNTYYTAIDPKYVKTIKEAEEYCKTLPPKEDSQFMENGKPMVFDVDLESVIDDLVSEYLKKKEEASIRRYEKKGILYGHPESAVIHRVIFNKPLAEILKDSSGQDNIAREIINRIKRHLRPGVKILNKNIPESVFIKAGLQKDQYTQPEEKELTRQQKKAPVKSVKKRRQ